MTDRHFPNGCLTSHRSRYVEKKYSIRILVWSLLTSKQRFRGKFKKLRNNIKQNKAISKDSKRRISTLSIKAVIY